MSLVRLIYASQLTEHFKNEDIEDIFNRSRRNNERNGVTGTLFFNRKYALQYLEGTLESVNQTYNRICADKRHSELMLMLLEDILHRDFSQWDLGFVPESSVTSDILYKYSSSRTFEPQTLTGKACLGFVLEIRNAVPIQ